MATLTKTYAHTGAHTSQINGRYEALLKKIEFSYFGFISMAILIGSIIGGVATMYVFENNSPMWEFALCLGFSMANNVFCIAQAPVKLAFNTFVLTVLVNAIIIALNVL